MNKHLYILQNCPLFQNIEKENLNGLLHCLQATPIKVAKNQYILSEGTPAKYVGILLSGNARIEQEDYYGNRSIVANIAPGELFGESFACAGLNALPVNVIATQDCEIVLLDCMRLMTTCSNACEFHNTIIFNMLKIMATKNLSFHRKITITSKRSTREKLMAYLLSEAKAQNSRSFTIPFDRQALADYLGVDRSGLSAEISKLRQEGIIECKKGNFTLL